MAILKSGKTLGVLLAGGVLVGAFLLNALLNVAEGGDSSGLLFLGLVALVVNDALEVVRGILVSPSGEAVVPAGEVGIALAIALIQNIYAPSVINASLLLTLAVFHNALLRASESGQGLSLVASLSLGTLGNIDCGLASLAGQTEGPARCLSSALFLTVLKGGSALGIFLAGSPLSGAFLLDALLRSGDGDSGGLGCN